MSKFESWKSFFDQTASDYERQSAGVTRKIGQQVLRLLPPITASSVVHDNACGPGVMTQEILSEAAKAGTSPPTIHATDYTEGMIKILQTIIDEHKLHDHVTAQVMNGSDLSKFSDNTFTHSITNFGMFAFPDPVAGAAHIRRTLKDGGVAAITTWKHPENIYFINEVREVLNPGSPPWFPLQDWLEQSKLPGILQEAGFEKDKIEISVKSTVWEIEDDLDTTVSLFEGPFWEPAKEALSEEQKGRWSEVVRRKLEERNGKGIDMTAWIAVVRK